MDSKMAQQDASKAQQQAAADTSVDEVLDSAQSSLNELQQAVGEQAAQEQEQQPMDLPELDAGGQESPRGIELLKDVDLDVTVELGRTEMLVEDVLRLGGGSVVELDKLAGDPVDVHVNGRLIARGEVLVLNDNFCIRISEIVADLEQEAEAAAQQEHAQADGQ